MAPDDPALRPSTRPEAYLAAERASESKHELWPGEVFAMAGASHAHNKIVTNLAGELMRGRVRDRPRDVLPSDMKIFVHTKSSSVYPDLSIVGGEPQFHDYERDGSPVRLGIRDSSTNATNVPAGRSTAESQTPRSRSPAPPPSDTVRRAARNPRTERAYPDPTPPHRIATTWLICNTHNSARIMLCVRCMSIQAFRPTRPT